MTRPEATEAAALPQAEGTPLVRDLPLPAAGPFRSKALQRIIDEVRADYRDGRPMPLGGIEMALHAYNRTYHRHNR